MGSTSVRLPGTRPLGASPAPPDAVDQVVWRELRAGLWVGRLRDVHIGTIERGRRYVLTDPVDETCTRHSTLLEAQEAARASATHLLRRRPGRAPASGSGRACRRCGAELVHEPRRWGREWTCSGCGRRSF